MQRHRNLWRAWRPRSRRQPRHKRRPQGVCGPTADPNFARSVDGQVPKRPTTGPPGLRRSHAGRLDGTGRLDPAMVDMVLSDGHDWANDHIATSKDDVEEVKNFLTTKSVVAEKLKGGQKKLDVAEPKGKITGADFKALRAMKKK